MISHFISSSLPLTLSTFPTPLLPHFAHFDDILQMTCTLMQCEHFSSIVVILASICIPFNEEDPLFNSFNGCHFIYKVFCVLSCSVFRHALGDIRAGVCIIFNLLLLYYVNWYWSWDLPDLTAAC